MKNTQKKIGAALMAVAMAASVAACTKTDEPVNTTGANGAVATGDAAVATDDAATGEIKEFTGFFAVPATTQINDDNEIQQLIAEKIGAKCHESWLTGETVAEAIGILVAGGEYPDFINGGDAMPQLVDAGALVAWDDYIDQYPNIKEFFSDYEWDQFRQADGHIYWMNPFENIYGEDKTTCQNGEAFWIQARVLEWDGYPEIKTLDQYFDLLERYNEANPQTPEGMDNIPYTILCEDWRYFCLENAPQFLDGYPNDGSVIVDVDTETIVDYNTTPTAKRYFQKLNEEYKKGIVDPESFTQTYDEYIAKLSTGRVLGMVDQWWDFAYTVNNVFATQGTEQYGYNYVPLGLTIEEGMENQWYTSGGTLNVSSGIAITTSCQDIDGAFKMIDDLLSQEIHDLRFWGVEGVDYLVDDDGLYYRTEDMRDQQSDSNYVAAHMCSYSYFPQWSGTSRDGINAMMPSEQPSEFMATLPDPIVNVFNAYGVTTYIGLLGSVNKAGCWFPMYSYSNNMNTSTEGGTAWTLMGECKHAWLPQVCMADDFDAKWEEYMQAYQDCNPDAFLAEMQEELDRRISGYNDWMAANG